MSDIDGVSKIQEELSPYVKSREQVNYIRRILAAHLGECANGGPITSALALANGRDADGTVTTDSTAPGSVYNEYLEALKENLAARKEFAAAREDGPEQRVGGARSTGTATSGLSERVALLKLHQKRDGLYAVQETLDTLLEQPAADSEFLDTDRMFHGTPPLPAVPKDVINTMVLEQSTSSLDISGHINQLEKVVLRAKLLLRQEEQMLHEARQRSRRLSQPPSQAAKLMALGATRDELINWIENELGKAAPDTQGAQDGEEGSATGLAKADPAAVQAKLGGIQEKYQSYISARREVLELSTSESEPILPQCISSRQNKRSSYAPPHGQPTDHLVAPYLASLVDMAANHKSMVVYRAHISNLLNRNKQDSSRDIENYAEESRLLSTFPQRDEPRQRSGADSASKSDLSTQVKPWVDASDAAKMANLETVAETVETGQIALEGLMQTLGGIGQITGKDILAQEGGEGDMWHGAETPQARRHTRKGGRAQSQSSTDPWSKVRGNLGLLGQDV